MKKGKFGALMQNSVLIFYDDTPQLRTILNEELHPTLRDWASHFSAKSLDTSVVKISMFKNPELCQALRINYNPTILLYSDGEMKFKIEVTSLEELPNCEQIYDMVLMYSKPDS